MADMAGKSATWTAEKSRKLMRVIMEWRGKGNTGSVDWVTVSHTYNNQSDTNRAVKQLKNHYNICKTRWKAWNELKNMTGMVLDERGLPSEEELQSARMKLFVKTHGSFVVKNELVDLDLWHAEFAGRLATGKDSFSPAMVKSRAAIKKGKEPAEEESGDSDDINQIGRMANLAVDDTESRSSTKTASTISSKKRKRASTSVPNKDDEEFQKAYEMIQLIAPRLSHAKRLRETIKNMEFVKERGMKFQVAALRFLKQNQFDDLFLECETDEERILWIQDVPH